MLLIKVRKRKGMHESLSLLKDQHHLNLVINRSWLWTSKLQHIRKWWDWMEPQNLWQFDKTAIDNQLSNSGDFDTALTFTRSIVHSCVVLEGFRTGVEWKHYLFIVSFWKLQKIIQDHLWVLDTVLFEISVFPF